MCCGTHGTTRIAFTLAPGLIPAARGGATLKADQLDTVLSGLAPASIA
jgi:hypothetical protein